MRSLKLVAASFAVIGASACVGFSGDDQAIRSPPPAGSPDVRMLINAMLPAIYEGVLPCADCTGMRYTLDIRADRVYFLRTTYLGKGSGEGDSHDEIGTWKGSADAQRVTLSGSGIEPLMLSIENPETLRLLDRTGQPIQSTLNYYLRRKASYRPLEPRVIMRGMYSYMADAARFRECLTQLTLPIAQEGDNAALERAYTERKAEPGAQVLATFDGRIALRPPMEGPTPVQTVVVDRFISIAPGQKCDSDNASAATPGG